MIIPTSSHCKRTGAVTSTVGSATVVFGIVLSGHTAPASRMLKRTTDSVPGTGRDLWSTTEVRRHLCNVFLVS
jgi:hypothetical protein